MKRKLLSIVLVLALVVGLFAGMSAAASAAGDSDFVPVTDITDGPYEFAVGVPLFLGGTVEPANATNKDIVWSVTDDGGTGATISGNILDTVDNGTGASPITLTATIKEGALSGSVNFKSISAGSHHAAAIKKDGSLWTWGSNSYGQLGDGTTMRRITPVRIGFDNDWAVVAAGNESTFAIKEDGSLWAWGKNSFGQLGDGTTIDRDYPVHIGSAKWKTVSATESTVAIQTDGSLWAWGQNNTSQLGDGTTTNRYSPVRIGTDNDWNSVSSGLWHTLAIKNNGSLWAWGQNSKGQLGIDEAGHIVVSRNPYRVGTDNDWKAVSASGDNIGHTVAIKNNGSLWAWGWNGFGQLGDGTTTNRYSPVRIGTDNDWQEVSAGQTHSHAIKNDGSLWSWGDNGNGQLGLGSTVARILAPEQVDTANDWMVVSTSNLFTIALKTDGLYTWGNVGIGVGNSKSQSSNSPLKVLSGYADFTKVFTLSLTENRAYRVWFFDGWQEDPIFDQYVIDGHKVVRPADLVRNGYKFLGWYTDVGSNTPEPFNFNKAVDESINGRKITAMWEELPPPKFNVTFILDEQTIEEGKTAVKPDDPTKDGYKFMGWVKGSSIFNFSTPITYNTTLRAKWEPAGSTGASIYGTVTSYFTDTGVTIKLLKGTNLVDMIVTLPPPKNNGAVEQEFLFENVAPGTYSLVVCKAGHLSYTKNNLVVGSSNVNLDEITLIPGDLDGDGSVTINDLNILLEAYGMVAVIEP